MYITSMSNNVDLGGTANLTETVYPKNSAGAAIIWLNKDANHIIKEEITHWLLSKSEITDIRFSPIVSDLLNIGFKHNSEHFPALIASLEANFPDANIIGS